MICSQASSGATECSDLTEHRQGDQRLKGPILTGWKRRSRAGSFSMCFLYSSRVVAPMHCSSPRARAGFRMLAASMAPSAAPAPIRVCTSSIICQTSTEALSTPQLWYSMPSIHSPRHSSELSGMHMNTVLQVGLCKDIYLFGPLAQHLNKSLPPCWLLRHAAKSSADCIAALWVSGGSRE